VVLISVHRHQVHPAFVRFHMFLFKWVDIPWLFHLGDVKKRSD
jgi:hypothetical protein